MKIAMIICAAVATCFVCPSRAETDISHCDNGAWIKLAVDVGKDDVVVVRSKNGPIAVVRFLSLKTNDVSFIWSYIDSSPQIRSSERLDKVIPRMLPGQQRVTEFPAKKKRSIEVNIAAEAQIKVGEILATLHAD